MRILHMLGYVCVCGGGSVYILGYVCVGGGASIVYTYSLKLFVLADILNQRAIDADDVISSQSDASTESALLALNPNLKMNIVSFNKKLLHQVTTVIKQWTPTTEGEYLKRDFSPITNN